jgi:hypothetical protein
MLADLVERLVSSNVKIDLEVTKLRFEVAKLQGEYATLKQQFEISRSSSPSDYTEKKIVSITVTLNELRATILQTMERENNKLRDQLANIQIDTQKKAIDEVKTYLESLPSFEAKFQDFLKQSRNLMGQKVRSTQKQSLQDGELITIMAEQINPFKEEISHLKEEILTLREQLHKYTSTTYAYGDADTCACSSDNTHTDDVHISGTYISSDSGTST